MKKTTFLATLILCSFLLPTLGFAQGALTPPGAPAPTMKRLDQVEPRTLIASLPFTITNSGAYYLGATLTGISGANGITIATNNVTIDLNGFALLGVPGSLHGIASTVALSDISILNGRLRSWGGCGINLSNCDTVLFKEVKVNGNGAVGLAAGQNAQVIDCVSSANQVAIITSSFSTIRNCICNFNSSSGITTTYFSTISGCSLYNDGNTEINANSVCNITDCTVSSQGQNCILVSSQCFVHHNNCVGNGSGGSVSGIHATGNLNRIEGNQVSGAGTGFKIDVAKNFTLGNVAFSNGTSYSIVAGNYTGTIVTTEAAMNVATNSNFNLSIP
ncbi:MAG: hypothetical protein JWR26_4654 [Pedosphaera sp.]|nr:hypothetical protein [Pedosphaera sp.]